MIYTILGLVALVLVGFFLYFKKVAHGWVQFRTGLALKFIPPLDNKPVVQIRKGLEAFINKRIETIRKSLPVSHVDDIDIPTRHGPIKARIYNNESKNGDKVIVMIHGGGWCIGSINTYEEVSRRLTLSTDQTVVSLEYSLAPEHKFPHAHDECVDAVSWISQNLSEINGNAKSLVLVGDSAGGNLIISTTYNCHPNVRKMISHLAAVYPAVDSRKTDYGSNIDYAFGYYLTKKSMDQFTEGLISSEEDLEDDRLSPLYYGPIDDFPATMVLTAEFDPLRDQGEVWANKMRKEGVKVVSKRYKGTIHAFFGLKDFGSQGVTAVNDINLFINGSLVPGAIG